MTRYLDRAAPDRATPIPDQQTRCPVQAHPPKRESFDVAAMTNVDPKGYVRAVDEYRVEPFGLYLARPMDGHPTMAYLESWLLPELGVRVTDFHFHPGAERDQDFYLDVATISRDGDVWHTVDLYLDIVVRQGRGLDVVDGDELIAASTTGLITPAEAEAALRTAFRAASGIAAHGHDVLAWLRAHDVPTTWRRHG